MAIIQIKWISINLKETDVIIARYEGSLLWQLPFNYSLHIKFWRQQTSIKLINNDIVNQKKKSDPPNNKQKHTQAANKTILLLHRKRLKNVGEQAAGGVSRKSILSTFCMWL